MAKTNYYIDYGGLMDTLVDYLLRIKNLSFRQEKLNELDVAFLTMMTYGKFEKLGIFSIKLKNIPYKILLEQVHTFENICHFGEDFNLANYIKTSKRYRNIRVSNVSARFSSKKGEQFLGVSYRIARGRYLIAYRGTDGTKTGWRENLSMSVDVVPAQKSALEYLHKAMKRHPLSKFIITGHSKGGNLSYYAMLNCSEKEQKRIIRCFNFDGPGFKETPNISRLNGKGIKLIPQDSLIGVLLNTTNNYNIVRSEGIRFEQHDVFNWNIDLPRRCFVRESSRSEFSKNFEAIINKWILSMSVDERRHLIKEISDIVDRRTDPKKETLGEINTKGIIFEAFRRDNHTLRKGISVFGRIYHHHKKDKKESNR